jgi:zinc transporter 1
VPESKSWRYWVVLWFTLGFCIAELAVAIITHSLALLSEAFHNFGDVFTLLIALYVDKHQSRSSDPSFSYGFRRAEVVGALVNGVSLLSLCVFVILQAIPRFFETVDVQSGMLFIVTASVGLLVNVLGVFCFAGHGHSHGLPGSGDACAHGHAHQHSHNEHTAAQSHGSPHAATRSLLSNEGGSLIRLRELSDAPPPCAHDHDHDHGHGHDHDHGHGHDHHGHSHDERHEHTEHEDMNMRAVFLHFIADSLSSICVLTVGLTLHFFHDAWWVVYVDPSSSLVIVAITLYLTYPLVRQCIAIVMQATPDQIDLVLLARELRNISPRVAHIHALHCWSQVPIQHYLPFMS